MSVGVDHAAPTEQIEDGGQKVWAVTFPTPSARRVITSVVICNGLFEVMLDSHGKAKAAKV